MVLLPVRANLERIVLNPYHDQVPIEARPKKWVYPVILVLLQEENSYGYEIMDRLQEEFGFEQIDPGSVYRTLRQMENEGLCKTEWDPLEGGQARRMYAITDEGEEFLDAWVEACARYRRVENTVSLVYRSRRTSHSSE
jgi:PadR family transcriptional regulator, regulatory protein PadR